MNTELENTETSNAERDDLPLESAEALITTMKSVVLDEAGLHIQIGREMLPARKEGGRSLSMFVVTLPEGATPEHLAEADYWLNEIAPLFRYS